MYVHDKRDLFLPLLRQYACDVDGGMGVVNLDKEEAGQDNENEIKTTNKTLKPTRRIQI